MSATKREFLKLSLATGLGSISSSFWMNKHAKADGYGPIMDAVQKLNAGGETLTVLYPQGSINNIVPVADAFLKQSNVKIEFVETTVDEINVVMVNGATSGRSNYDIALPATFGIPDLVEANALASLTDFEKKYETTIECETSLYSLGDTYKGQKYGYQTDGDVYLMFYNGDHLNNVSLAKRFEDKFGQSPKVPKTWAELDTMMEFYHAPQESKFGGSMFRSPTYVLWEWWIRMHALGSLPVNNDFGANTSSDAGIQALEDLIRMTEFQHPSVTQNGLFDNWSLYAEGECFANIGWGGTQKFLNSDNSSVKGKLLFSPTPEVSYFNWGWNYVVSNYSQNKELAYLFCLFATLPEISTAAVRGDGFFDPFRANHYDDQEIIDVYSKPFLDAHKEGMSNAIPDFYVEGKGRYFAALRDNLASALDGIITPAQALQFTDLQWDKITEEIGPERQAAQWKQLRQSYPA